MSRVKPPVVSENYRPLTSKQSDASGHEDVRRLLNYTLYDPPTSTNSGPSSFQVDGK